jgi:hypothetical protein
MEWRQVQFACRGRKISTEAVDKARDFLSAGKESARRGAAFAALPKA